MTSETIQKGNQGVRGVGAQAPRQRRQKFTAESIQRMSQLSFDPITELVKSFHIVNEELMDTKFDKNGNKKDKYDHMHFASILSERVNIAKELMRYRYPRVPETLQLEAREIPGVTIQLTTHDTFDVDNMSDSVAIDNETQDFIEIEEDVQEEPAELVHLSISNILKVPRI